MKSKKVLSMKFPPVTAYEEQANALAIILNNEQSLPWIYSNLIHMEVFRSGEEETKLHFYKVACGLIENNSVSFKLMERGWDNIIDFLIECVDLDYYIKLTVDKYYIPKYNIDRHVRHNILIFGYDTEKGEFDIADNFDMGVYSFEKCTFSQLEQAYSSMRQGNVEVKKNIFNLINVKKNYEYKFNLNFYIESLECYISSKNIPEVFKEQYIRYKKDWKYGMACYEFLHNEIDGILENKKFHGIRSFHALLEHKTIMLDGIKYIGENNILNNYETYYNDYSKVKEKAKAVRNRIIKYGATGDNAILEKAKEILYEIKQEEEVILKSMLKELKS